MHPRLAALVGASFVWASSLAAQDPAPPAPVPVSQDRAHELNAEGVRLFEAARYGEAVAKFEAARGKRPEDATIARNLARALHARTLDLPADADPRPAIADLERAIALDAGEPEFRLRLAQIWRARQNLGEARRVLQAALARHPGEARLHELLGRVEYEDENLVDALELLETAAKLDPERAKAWSSFLEKVRREAEVEKGYFRDVRGSFVVKYDDQEFRDVGLAVLDLLDRTYQRLAADLAHWPSRRITVVLYTRGDYDSATGAHAWTGGLFDGKIRLPVRNYTQVSREIATTVAHEMTHFFVRSLTSHCPLWLNEGLAQVQEGRRSQGLAGRLVREARDENRLPRMSSLPKSWASIKDAALVRLHYAASLSFTEFLIQRHGWPAVSGLLAALDGKQPFASVFERAFGSTLDQAEDDWRRGL